MGVEVTGEVVAAHAHDVYRTFGSTVRGLCLRSGDNGGYLLVGEDIE